MSKSYVTMEQRLCSCCGKEYETNSILLDTKMRERFDMLTTTGYGQCNKCKKEGYVTIDDVGGDRWDNERAEMLALVQSEEYVQKIRHQAMIIEAGIA